ncbi:MAG: hypothetical protein IPN33_21955 [Saprospiraceae bacterium]|nr:hypothetical protein [Saprospiraceae bacterium]
MRNKALFLSWFVLFTPLWLFGQDCGAWIAENKVVGGTHILRSQPVTLVVRGNYSYSIEIMSDDRGIIAKMYSKAGVEFNQEDELIVLDMGQNRRSFRFIGMGEMTQDKGTPVHQNILQLDLPAVQWFSSSDIATLYIKNNINNEMRKFTDNPNRQLELRHAATCFMQMIDKSKVVEVDITEVAKPTADGKEKPISATKTNVKKPVDMSSLSDDELNAMRKELKDTKDKLRAEIEEEKVKAGQIKQQLQQEVALARENAAQQKKLYADEVLEARKKSQEEIEQSKKQIAAQVMEARQKADTEIEHFQMNVVEAKQKAAEEVQKAQVQSAQEIAAAREKAAQELKAAKEKLELAKMQYADEVSSARDNSTSEIKRIREETAALIQEARTKAQGEREKTVEDVVTSKKLPQSKSCKSRKMQLTKWRE